MAFFGFSVFLFPFLFVPALAQPTSCARGVSPADVSTAFSNAGLVPGVIPVFNPSGILDVVFTIPTTQQALNATPGANLTVQQTVNEPQLFLTSDNTNAPDTEYVVALFDPDAPTPQNASLAQFRHLLGGGYRWNVTGSNPGILANMTPALTDFFPPGPPPRSDPHRYMVLLYVQSQDFESKAASVVNASTPRTNFNITAFSDVLSLGSPFAGTFFFTGPKLTGSTSASGSTTTGTPAPSGAVSNHGPLTVSAALLIILLAYFSI
ncbi:phosphatidylethanolamine-binding protein [Mycena maculata]|uniref:Phosphatidylethanolamine-binding protein n=1 Tax=Mycena maculata TaxID=230809 RepID=A0AAD7HJ23_9AGAR|nr:phosphatidylethanolamine-binding protein [Mycena maculata]